MADLGRRDFLKVVGLAGTSAAMGRPSESARTLIPHIIPPEDIIPGKGSWFATTCRECPAGCGMVVKNLDGRAVKVEGNPLHPVNGGKLCARGQASLHGLYNPDRFAGPMQRVSRQQWKPLDWITAEEVLVGRLEECVRKGRGERIVFLTDIVTDTMRELIALWLSELGGGEHVIYEPFAYESLRTANGTVFGTEAIPAYHIDRADFLISFGAGFLETWLSNVEYARRFASFHTPVDGRRNFFVYVGPRLSMTAANADLWIPVAPGDEYLVAIGLMRTILDGDLSGRVDEEAKSAVKSAVGSIGMDTIVSRTGVTEETFQLLARRFAEAEKPLALAEGLSLTAPNATQTAVAANLLCTMLPGTRELIDFSAPSAYGLVVRAAALKELSERMRAGEVDVLLVHNANPLFSLPQSWEFQRSLEGVPAVVSFSSAVDETSQFAHLVLPTDTPLESWGDYSPKGGITGLLQPVMGRVFDSRHLGDILISSAKKVVGPERFPWESFYQVLRNVWGKKGREEASGTEPDRFWREAVRTGGFWGGSKPAASQPAWKTTRFTFSEPDDEGDSGKGFHFTAYPTVQYFDGRGANRPWLQELPDPIAQTTWGTWVEIHPDTAGKLGIRQGNILVLESPHGTVEAPALPLPNVPPDTLAMPIGQGHTDYGRFAGVTQYGNPMGLLSSELDRISGGITRSAFRVTIDRKRRNVPIAHTDGSLYQHGRGLVRNMSLEQYREGIAARHEPHLYLPLPEGYDAAKDFYPAHDHVTYRWGMVIDLDRCIGCGACVVGCYAENNVAIVGREQVLMGREMSWLRVQRYFDEDRPVARWLVLPCQHCDNAPCESVCPVYAPHHSKEGLNNQIYNRCIGTRFCAQNCPYKIRRFNWFTFTRAEPLNWQLNPNVTVRQKGVMEKCSFCIQRIVEAKREARDENRLVRDGEFTTACAQTCPTDTIVFGNLMDPESRVSRLLREHRAYQVLDHLNTKPAVIYLRRLMQDLGT